MEFFRDVHSVRLLGHKGKYLWADDDRRSVAQKKGRDSYGVIWRVELVPERNAIKLKSVYDLYLFASDYLFLLGATGKKVMQSLNVAENESLEWEPIAAGTSVKLRTKGDKFLRANGGVPPYRNSVTHDVPVLASNKHVVLWEVEVVRKKEPTSMPCPQQAPKQASVERPESPLKRRPQLDPNYDPESSVPPPLYVRRPRPRRRHSAPTEMDFPLPDEESSSPSEIPSPVSSPPRRRRSPPLSQSVDSTPPRRHRVPVPPQSLNDPPQDDYDSPFSKPQSPERAPRTRPNHRATVSEVPNQSTAHDDDNDYGYDSSPSEASPPTSKTSNLRISEDDDEHDSKARLTSPRTPPVKSSSTPNDVRRIFYTIADDDGQALAHDDETFGSFLFKGHSLAELTEALQLETGIDDDIILCMRNPLTQKLYKMRLQLPPNKAPLSVVVVRHDSQFGRTLSLSSARQR